MTVQLVVCEPYSCRLTVESCAKRYVRARDGEHRFADSECRGCEVGAERAKGVDVAPPKRGRGWSLETSKRGGRARAAMVREEIGQGDVIGTWTILREVEPSRRNRRFRARHSCGHVAIRSLNALKSLRKHCAKCEREARSKRMRGHSIRLGERFGSWEVVGEEPSQAGHLCVRVRCACGEESRWQLSKLRRGVSTRCRYCAARARRGKVYSTANRLTPDDVRLIRAAVKRGHTQNEVAEMFGITGPTVHKIAHRQIWKEVV